MTEEERRLDQLELGDDEPPVIVGEEVDAPVEGDGVERAQDAIGESALVVGEQEGLVCIPGALPRRGGGTCA